MSEHELFSLDGRVAIVTGASGGLGERFARVLAARGVRVIAAARRTAELERLAAEVDGVDPVTCDVARDDDLAALAAHAVDRHGRVDILVNNAGMGIMSRAEEEPMAQFRQIVDVNLNAVFGLSQLVGRTMLAQGSGSIVNIASIFGLGASAPIRHASYTASKGAVVNLTRELGAQWMRRGVRVNAIAPGFFASDMNTELLDDERSRDFLHRQTPAGRIGEPHELDGALVFLASDASSFVCGQTLAVDGGWTIR
jgi:NAD(P)-dependent dehydrogenase (short-subunit alcohol dehydrogenase family)